MDRRALERQRLAQYRLSPAQRLRTAADAVRYIDRSGFCWLFAPRDRKYELPSLFEAVKGKRDTHIDDWDSDSEKIWAWKSDLPAARRAYYGKGLAGKPSFVSLTMLPAVLAALGEADPSRAYAHGALPQDAWRIYQALAQFGAQPTQTLKRNAGFVGKDGNTRFHRALDVLQHKLIAAPMGATSEGLAWPSQIFDLVAHWFPEPARAAQRMDLNEARGALVERYLKTVLAAPADTIARLFAIPRDDWKQLADELHAAKRIRVTDDWLTAPRVKF